MSTQYQIEYDERGSRQASTRSNLPAVSRPRNVEVIDEPKRGFRIPSILKTASVFALGALALTGAEKYGPVDWRPSTIVGTYDGRIAATVKAAELNQQARFDAWAAEARIATDQNAESYRAMMNAMIANYQASYDRGRIYAEAATRMQGQYASMRMNQVATDEEALLEAMGFAARPGPRPSMNEEVDLAISEALKGPFELRIHYQGRGDVGPSWRSIEPLGLLLGSRRYLVGIDTSKRDGRYRHYRVEDILEAKVQPKVFTYPGEFDLREYATRAFGSYHHDAEYGEVVWKFSPEAADRAARFQFHPTQEIDRLDDGSMLVRFQASGHLEMSWHLYAWGDCVEVISPPSLAGMVHPYRRSDFAALP